MFAEARPWKLQASIRCAAPSSTFLLRTKRESRASSARDLSALPSGRIDPGCARHLHRLGVPQFRGNCPPDRRRLSPITALLSKTAGADGTSMPRTESSATGPTQSPPTRLAEDLQKLVMKFSPAGYLSPTSDIVALMTFEHQTQMNQLHHTSRLESAHRRGLHRFRPGSSSALHAVHRRSSAR